MRKRLSISSSSIAFLLCAGLLVVMTVSLCEYEPSNRRPSAVIASRMSLKPLRVQFVPGQKMKVAVMYGGDDTAKKEVVLAYRDVLKEEGFAVDVVNAKDLQRLSASEIVKEYPAIIMPEYANRRMSEKTARVLRKYAAEDGGNLLVVWDAAMEDESGRPFSQWPFADVLGVKPLNELVPPPGSNDLSGLYLGPWVIPRGSPLRAYFDQGLFFEDSVRIYEYPVLQDYHRHLREVDANVLAYGRKSKLTSAWAVFTVKEYAKGGIAAYINGCPGVQKVQGNNDFMLRVPLRFFLIEMARLPRLVAAPNGVGGLAVGIHVCSGVYLKDLDRIFKQNLLSNKLRFSFSVTAGPDCDAPGDGKGFDVLNAEKGMLYVNKFTEFGSVGSQGGWIHNLWGFHFKELTSDRKRELIDLNYGALAKVTGLPVTEYAAPGGAHSKEVNDHLARWGTKVASVPACFHSPPTRAWFSGEKEERFWVLGYTGTQFGMCLENMLRNGRSPKDIVGDMHRLIDDVIEDREIRLFYTHPVSIANYQEMWNAIQDYLLARLGSGEITVRTMTEYADFMSRHQSVEFSITYLPEGFLIRAESPYGLREMTFALPCFGSDITLELSGSQVRQSKGWCYITINQDTSSVEFLAKVRKP